MTTTIQDLETSQGRPEPPVIARTRYSQARRILECSIEQLTIGIDEFA